MADHSFVAPFRAGTPQSRQRDGIGRAAGDFPPAQAAMNGLHELLAAATKLQTFLLDKGWRFCFIGGIAVQRWGNPRFTQDIDLTLMTGFGDEERFVDILLEGLEIRRPDARAFALQNRVLLAQTREGVDVDVALGALPFEDRSVSRATPWKGDGFELTTCSAEDLIVHKAFAGRERDWDDLESVLVRQHQRLDLTQIRSELAPLLELKGEVEALDKLERITQRVRGRLNR